MRQGPPPGLADGRGTPGNSQGQEERTRERGQRVETRFWPCDREPRFQGKSPSSKNSRPSSTPCGSRAGLRARRALWETAQEQDGAAGNPPPHPPPPPAQVGGAREHFWDASHRLRLRTRPAHPLRFAGGQLQLPPPHRRLRGGPSAAGRTGQQTGVHLNPNQAKGTQDSPRARPVLQPQPTWVPTWQTPCGHSPLNKVSGKLTQAGGEQGRAGFLSPRRETCSCQS